ncbi:MAG: FtsX-like permease family protein [Clostridiales bacterium]|nr:FtsX-like permease family protein [Clostridiales bacterium]
MNIILKNSLKNVFGKPLRTLLVVFSIFVCSLSALICFDLGGTIDTVLSEMYSIVSPGELIVTAGRGNMSQEELESSLPACKVLSIESNTETIYKDIEGEYNYVTTESMPVMGLDLEKAAQMGVLDPCTLGENEGLITSKLAADFGYEVGDTITVHDRAENKVEITVAGLIPEGKSNYLISSKYSVVVNTDTMNALTCGYTDIKGMYIVDLEDNDNLEEAKQILEDRYPDASVITMVATERDMNMVNELKAFLYLLFAITFLLVIFVTISICNRIVAERMSFVGTLRSLGMSSGRTARILLLENVLYAVLGCIPALIIYGLVREPMLSSMFTLQDTTGEMISYDIPAMSVFLVAGVVIGAIVIECLIPLRAILKALKTSIRDIIFDNRDTAYRFSKSLTVTGFVFLALSVVCFFFRTNFIGATLCTICLVTSVALLFPLLLKYIAGLVQSFSDKKGDPKWSLAGVETISRKSTVGSGVLCATAATMTIIVLIITTSVMDAMNLDPYSCDVVAQTTENAKYYSYIDHLDGVTDFEMLYTNISESVINDEEKPVNCSFYGLPEGGYKYYSGFTGLPDQIEEGVVWVDSRYAKRAGVSVGDPLTVTIDPDGVFPIKREYTVGGIYDLQSLEGTKACFFINLDEYRLVFNDKPFEILICCDSPDTVASILQTYGKGTYSQVKTHQALFEENEMSKKRFNAIMTAIIAVALGMTCVGMITNQLIGFEGRKKECAVLLSTSMTKKQLSGILFREVLLASVTAAGTGTVAGVLLCKVISAAVENSDGISLPIDISPVTTILFFLLLVALFTLTVLFPIRSLKKMKISEQIKYE